MHQRHFQTERGRLGVNAVAAADHRREFVLLRLGSDDLAQVRNVLDKDVGRLNHLHCKGGVANVRAGQAVVQPTLGRVADVLADVGGEGDDVVVQRLFELFAALDGEGGFRLHLRQILLGDEALTAKRFAGQQLDLQPDFQFPLFRPDFPHGGP